MKAALPQEQESICEWRYVHTIVPATRDIYTCNEREFLNLKKQAATFFKNIWNTIHIG